MVVVGIATIPSRIEQVKKTIESLLPQVDEVLVSLNNFYCIPDELIMDRVYCSITQGTDEQKFMPLFYSNRINQSCSIYLTCDDDLIFPTDYVMKVKEALYTRQYHNAPTPDIISFHGRNFNSFPIQSYYKSAGSKYRCLDKVAQDVPVQFGGTGCMAFKPANFNVTLKDFPSKYMADVHLAIKAKKEGKKIMCIAHEAGWIKYQPVSNTIYDRFRDNDGEQTERVNEAFGVKCGT